MKSPAFLSVSASITALCLALVVPPAAQAQAKPPFPTKTVTLVVPFTANSGSDTIARIVGPKLALRWGQGVIVDNKAGASGSLGANAVAKAPADGHTLLMAVDSFTMTPALLKSLPYDPAADFQPVALLAESAYAFAVHPSVAAKDVKAMVEYVKKNPGKINYGSPGNGTPHHLTMELLKGQFALDMVHVPYKGIAGALTDLMGGQVQMIYATVSSLKPFAQSGKVRLLAVTGTARSPLAPDVPTLREQGLETMDSGNAYYFVLAPAALPADLTARLQADYVAVMNTDEVKADLAKLGLTVNTQATPAQLGALLKADLVRWRKVVTAAGITAD
jgi:tripartite-type tricarboxylate transporter receptor subunit TctC